MMPGNAYFNQSMASLGCNNANWCLRAFGTFNGQDGWFSTCGSDDKCKVCFFRGIKITFGKKLQ